MYLRPCSHACTVDMVYIYDSIDCMNMKGQRSIFFMPEKSVNIFSCQKC